MSLRLIAVISEKSLPIESLRPQNCNLNQINITLNIPTPKMSDNIPLEIQMEIIQRIPDIKSVIQFRSVSKAWKSIIDSKEFVTGHTRRHIQQQPRHLLIRGMDSGDPPKEVKYVSIVDDDTFPLQKVSLSAPDSVKILSKSAALVGSSHGLFCLHDDNRKMVVIWNPSIRKTVIVPYEGGRWNDVAFGVCPNTLDPKIVKITRNADRITQAEVFTLSLGAWRSPLSNTCPRELILLGHSQAVVDGFIYCIAYARIEVDGVYTYRSPIMSFNMISEEFTELYLPNPPYGDLSLSILRESLGIFQFKCSTNTLYVVNVWIMKGCGCTRSFERLYHISSSDASICTALAFQRSGAPMVEMENDRTISVALVAYEPESKDITEIWRDGRGAFRVHSYMKTLLLLDQ